jgi:hypothetical protein
MNAKSFHYFQELRKDGENMIVKNQVQHTRRTSVDERGGSGSLESIRRGLAAVTIVYMLVMGIWMLNASAVAAFDSWGKDRVAEQFLPMVNAVGLHGRAALVAARAMQVIDATSELIIAVLFLAGVFRPQSRMLYLGLGTAGLVLLFGGFLAVCFTYSGYSGVLASVGEWFPKYPVLIAIAVGVYVGITIVTSIVHRDTRDE